MTRGAGSSAIEIRLPGFGVPRLEIGIVHAAAATLFGIGFLLFVMNEGGEFGDLLRAEVEGGHTRVGPPAAHDGANFVAGGIGRHQLGACKIGPRLTASSVAAMAESAMLQKDGLTVFNVIRRMGRTDSKQEGGREQESYSPEGREGHTYETRHLSRI